MITLPLQCSCGAVRGQADYTTKSDMKRFICYCGDCQTFPQFLGNADQMLDRNGGSEIIPAYHWKVKFTDGAAHLKSVRLSDDGMIRWYTDCCKTPVGNSVSDRMPYIGLLSPIVNVADRDTAIGPIVERLMGAHGIPPLPAGTRKSNSIGFLLYVLRFMLKGFFARKGQTSTFFKESGEPIAPPLVLSDAEYIRLRAKTNAPWREK